MKKKNKILELQANYEAGLISEQDLSKEQKDELIALYKEQIKILEEKNILYTQTLENYKNKIIEKRKQLKTNK